MALQLDELDYYSLLGVTADASISDIKAGFRAFALRYHPDRFGGDEEAARIYRRGTEAYRVLTHPQQRRCYDEQYKQGKLRMDPQTGSARPRSGGPDAVHARARPFLARADQALAAGDLKQAKLNYQVALQHDPGSELLRQRLAEVESRLVQR
ncbi:MAG TPA: DnaJ domain-containing protein [Polyangiales bacterium]|jgi:DnaJ-class molecular chaperone|nr:DnaJ domain-containing protein [Polyangiales bacterium]